MTEDAQVLKKLSGWGMAWGILTMLFGFVAMSSPLISGLAITVVIGITLLAAGLSMTIFAFKSPSLGRGVLRFLFGGLTILVGIAVIAQPGIALLKLTILLGIYFIFDGISTLIVAWNVKPENGWGWLTFSGAVTIVLAWMLAPEMFGLITLAWMVLSGWPESSLVVVGLLVGIRLVFSGATMLTLGSAGRQVGKAMQE